MKKVPFTTSLMLFVFCILFGQNVLVDPSSDGGFETGATFTANGWTVVHSNQNKYQIGSIPGVYEGSRCAFISKNSSSWSSANKASTIHIYRQVTFPASVTDISLSFRYKLDATDAGYDGFKVYLATAIPNYNSYPVGTQIGDTWYDSATSWQEENIDIADSFAGTTCYLVMTWRNDRVNPRAVGALDNISLTTSLPGLGMPRSFSVSPQSPSELDLSWQKNQTNDNVLIAYNTSNSFGVPVDSQSYSVGDYLGSAEIIYSGSGTSFAHTGLEASTTYYYQAWSVDSANHYSYAATASGQTMDPPISVFPYTENFENDSTTRSLWTQEYVSSNHDWSWATGSSGGSVTAAHSGSLNAQFTGSGSGPHITKLISPVFDLSAFDSAELGFWYAQEVWYGDQNELKVYYRSSPLSAWVQLEHYVDSVAAWDQEVVDLPNLSSTYQIAFEGIDYYGYANVLDDVTIQVSSSDPIIIIDPGTLNFSYLVLGDTASLGFSISNSGGATLSISRAPAIIGIDEAQFELIDLNTYPLELSQGQSASYTVEYQPQTVGTHSAQVSISAYNGENLVQLNGIALSEIYSDDFETYTDFSLDLSPWTQYDGDGGSTYTISDYTFTNEGYTGSFIAFNPSNTSPVLPTNWNAYSGAKYAACFASTTPPNNDWLISPQVSVGNATVISFQARSINATYGLERFKVLYSTSGNSPEDFTNYLAGSASAHIEAPISWQYYEYTLPPSCVNKSVYFAIQCVSNDAFVFMVDDFRIFSDVMPAPVASITPDPIIFDDFFPNYARYESVTISNTGTGLLSIEQSGINLSGDDEFSLDTLPAFPIQLSQGQSSSFYIKFLPAEPGSYSSSLSITDNTLSTQQISISATTIDDLITEFPYMEGFEEDVSGWIIRDGDGDGYNWELLSNTAETDFAFSGNSCIISHSYVNDSKSIAPVKNAWIPPLVQGGSESKARPLFQNSKQALSQDFQTPKSSADQPKGVLTPDNWLISPRLQIEEDYSLTWMVSAQDPDWMAENYSVLISNTTPDVDQFTQLHTETINQSGWLQRSLSLADYAEDTIYIAFRHHNCTDQFFIKLDDIKIKKPNTEIQGAIVESNAVSISLDPITDTINNNSLSVSYNGSGLSDATVITSFVAYNQSGLGFGNSGLHMNVHGATWGGSRFEIVHNLGFVPPQAF